MPRPARAVLLASPEPADAPQLSEPWFSLREAYHIIRRERAHLLLQYHLSLSEYLVLSLCARSPPKASEVAHEVGITPSGATDLIDRLERRRLVVRTAHPRDRRVVLVRITPAGERLRRSAQSRQWAILHDVNRRLTTKERRALTVGLSALTQALVHRSREA